MQNRMLQICFTALCCLIFTGLYAGDHYIDSLSKAFDGSQKKPIELAKAFEKEGINEARNKRYLQAIACDEKAIELYHSAKKFTEEASVYLHKGDVHYTINDFENSLENYLNALDLYEKEKKEADILSTKQLIGELYLRMEQCDQAFKNFYTVYQSYQSDKDRFKAEIPKNLQSLGITHGRCGSLDSALYYFQHALSFVDQPYSGMFTGGLLNNIGAIYSKRDDHQKALDYYEQALLLFRRDSIQQGIGVSLSNKALIYMKQNRLDESIALFHEALEIFEKTRSLVYLRDNCLNISEAYELNGDPTKALYYNNQYLELNDSISNADILARISDLQIQFEIKKKDQEQQLMEQKNALSRFRLYLIIGGVIGLLIIIYLAYRNQRVKLRMAKLKEQILNQEKRQLETEVEFKSHELEGFALKIIEKNEVLGQLKEELRFLSKEEGTNGEKIKELSQEINNQLYIEKDRKEFEFQLDKNYQSFFLKLDQRFPSITKYERRLCSLLAMDLSTKDIAIILNISPDSVKKSRQRLRKKLELEKAINLSEFLKNL